MRAVSPCNLRMLVSVCDGCGRETLLLDEDVELPIRNMLDDLDNTLPPRGGPGAWLHLIGASTGGLDFCPDCLPPVVDAAVAAAKHRAWLDAGGGAP